MRGHKTIKTWPARARARVVPVLGAVTLSGLAACSSSPPVMKVDGIRVTAAISVHAPASQVLTVAKAWIASYRAADEASLTNDWNSPLLLATTAGSELASVQRFMVAEARDGYVARGTDRIVSVQVTSVAGSQATVEGCVDGHEISVGKATGQPQAGVAGQAGWYLTTGWLTKSGGKWKVIHAKGVQQQCEGS
jgi:hypothetical protein